MAREQMQTARALIEQGHYEEAKALLQRVRHPLAQEWIAKIDARLETEERAAQAQPTLIRNKRRRLFIIGAIILTLGIFAILFLNIRNDTDRASASVRLWSECLSIEIRRSLMSDDQISDYCSTFAGIYRDDERLLACHRLSPTLDAPFRQCLIDEEILR